MGDDRQNYCELIRACFCRSPDRQQEEERSAVWSGPNHPQYYLDSTWRDGFAKMAEREETGGWRVETYPHDLGFSILVLLEVSRDSRRGARCQHHRAPRAPRKAA